jgi:mannose-6-phosphate isomerase
VILGISNTPRDYAWGARGKISALLGWAASDAPEAELWLGDHPGSPARVVESTQTLADVEVGRLPFLLKVLAAGSPLSLQAHPTMAQAQAGFARENALGIPLDAANRNYKDAYYKPELIYAVSEAFEALCGFRSAAQAKASFDLLGVDVPLLTDDASLRTVFEWLITRGEGVDALIADVVAAADGSTPALATVLELAEAYPGDPGIVISLMLNRVTLEKGEVLYLPAGNIHAYLRGVGIELMASSDNVLRGGLTPKHIDVPELLSVLDFTPVPVPYLAAEHPSPGVEVFRPDVPDFVLVTIEDEGSYAITGPAIALCTDGDLEIVGSGSAYNLSRGDAVYITPDEGALSFAGLGTVFLATTGG